MTPAMDEKSTSSQGSGGGKEKYSKAMIRGKTQPEMSMRRGEVHRTSRRTHSDPVSMKYKSSYHELICDDRNISNSIDFVGHPKGTFSNTTLENDTTPQRLISNGSFQDEKSLRSHKTSSRITSDIINGDFQSFELTPKTPHILQYPNNENCEVAARIDEPIVDAIENGAIQDTRVYDVNDERQKLNDKIDKLSINEIPQENVHCPIDTIGYTSPHEIKDDATSRSESTQTERIHLIRAVRSCPSYKKRVRLNFLKIIHRQPEFRELLFMYRKSSDNLIFEKRKGSLSPAYVSTCERFRWKYLTNGKKANQDN